MSKKGLLMVLSGPSGVGKDAVRLDFLKECPTITSSVSATTRPIRPGEIDGVDYFSFPEAYASVTPEDVLQFIRQVIRPERAALSIILPNESEESA